MKLIKSAVAFPRFFADCCTLYIVKLSFILTLKSAVWGFEFIAPEILEHIAAVKRILSRRLPKYCMMVVFSLTILQPDLFGATRKRGPVPASLALACATKGSSGSMSCQVLDFVPKGPH
jgi:hypothetical protein